MNEYGSFLELDLKFTGEYYNGINIKRLNTARCGVFYVLKLLNLNKIFIPLYMCKTVIDFLLTKGIEISYYNINEDLLPVLPAEISNDTAVLIVNYFGIIPTEFLAEYSRVYGNIIIDNSQAFFKAPIENTYSVYSTRKFFGVCDGCYVIGEKAGKDNLSLEDDLSSETADFLLKRLEVGCERSYADRMKNEERLDKSDIKNMSKLTKALLNSIDYEYIKQKRRENYLYMQSKFSHINNLNLYKYPIEADTAPLVYPLIIEDESILNYLNENKIFIGRWWSYLTEIASADSMEMWFSKYMLPLPIDQRMNFNDIDYIYDLIVNYRRKNL